MKPFVVWVLTAVAVGLGGCAAPGVAVRATFRDSQYSVLTEPLSWTLGDSAITIHVPAGFVTDGASIPRFAQCIFPKYESYDAAAIIHDYVYWVQPSGCTKANADALLELAMYESGVDIRTIDMFDRAVSSEFNSAWWGNRKEKSGGGIRFLARADWRAHDKDGKRVPNMNWPEYQKILKDLGVSDLKFDETELATACSTVTTLPKWTEFKRKLDRFRMPDFLTVP